MANSKRLAAGILIGAVVFTLSMPSAAFADITVEVHDVGELTVAVEAAAAGEVTEIIIATDFAPIGPVTTLNVPAGAIVEIAGADPAAPTTVAKIPGNTDRHFAIQGAAGSTVTVKNLRFAGQNTVTDAGARSGNDRGGGISANNVALTIENTIFSGIFGPGAVSLGAGVTPLSVTKSSFLGNSAGSGSALSLNSDTGPITIDDSTFLYNDGTQTGYPGGAITSKDSMQSFTITNSLFRSNTSILRGGAIALDYYGGIFTVTDSIFENNSITAAGIGNSNADGGAIAVVSRENKPASSAIRSSTFANNIAQDEGGAALFQTGATSAVEITNSTFFGNSSAGSQSSYDDSSGGGAIEFFGTPATLNNNTFVNNRAERGKLLIGVSQRGGAISGYGSGTVWPAQPLTLSYNLFVGNTVTRDDGTPDVVSKYQQVFSSKGITLPDDPENPTELTDADVPGPDSVLGSVASNVGIDNGTLLDASVVNLQTVLGTGTAALAANQNPKRVGDPRWAGAATPGYVTPLTVAILMKDSPLVGGLADNILPGSSGITTDARGFPVDMPNADAGALQSSWVRFDTNGGAWTGLPSHEYDGERYYDSSAAEVEQIWSYHPIGFTVDIEAAPTVPPAVGDTFTGWNTAQDGSGVMYQPGDTTLAAVAGNLALFAQWESVAVANSTVTVRFVDEADATLSSDVVLTGPVGSQYTTSAAVVDGYRLVSVPPNASGFYAQQPIVVLYQYEKIAIAPTPPCNPNDNNCDPLVTTGANWGTSLLWGAGILTITGLASLLIGRLRRRMRA